MLVALLLAINPAHTSAVARCRLHTPWRRGVAVMLEPPPSEEERRKRLQQLFGEDASKIADRTATKKVAADEPAREIQMLVEGMQQR